MRYLRFLFACAAVTGLLYMALVQSLSEAPIPAEYWVHEMILVKENLVKQIAGRRKIVVAGGSSTLFGIDARQASRELGMPVFNFGLHASLRLQRILQESAKAVQRGDILVLALEFPFYDCAGLTNWQVENLVGWGHDAQREMSLWERLKFLVGVAHLPLSKLIEAEYDKHYSPKKIAGRLAALDRRGVLQRYRDRSVPTKFEYSAENLDNLGDMLNTQGQEYTGKVLDISHPDHVCRATQSRLHDFVEAMKARGVSVYFLQTPYIDEHVDMQRLRQSETSFLKDMRKVGCVIDRREDELFARKYFFNTFLHLTAEGRKIRTRRFVDAIRAHVLSGQCRHAAGPP